MARVDPRPRVPDSRRVVSSMIRIRHPDDPPDPCPCGDCSPHDDTVPGMFTTWAKMVGCVWLAFVVAGVGLGFAWRVVVWVKDVGR